MAEVSTDAISHLTPKPSSRTSRSLKGSARDRLLYLAGPVFAARGFDDVTVRELAAAADVNVASVGYHFGDKIGLYHAVIDAIGTRRRNRLPISSHYESDPHKRLEKTVGDFLDRLRSDPSNWETQLLMREIQKPTPVFDKVVRVIFRPQFDCLVANLKEVSAIKLPRQQYERTALSLFGQCVYYATNSSMIRILISAEHQNQYFDIRSLTAHIVASTLKTLQDDDFERASSSRANAPHP